MARRGTRITFCLAWSTLFVVAMLGAGAAIAATTGPNAADVGAIETRYELASAGGPVLLIHGWRGSPAAFTALGDRLRSEGHPVQALALPGEDNYRNAEAIADAVAAMRSESGGVPVALVGHSMGGLSARHYLQYLGGADSVGHYVSLGTAHLGYTPTCGLPVELAGQMCPTSPFMTGLSQGDPTPGPAHFVTLTSSLDDTRDQRLEGAACHREIAGVPHAEEPTSPEFAEAVVTALAGACP